MTRRVCLAWDQRFFVEPALPALPELVGLPRLPVLPVFPDFEAAFLVAFFLVVLLIINL
jgi:hypothetical protein